MTMRRKRSASALGAIGVEFGVDLGVG